MLRMFGSPTLDLRVEIADAIGVRDREVPPHDASNLPCFGQVVLALMLRMSVSSMSIATALWPPCGTMMSA
jgi:hypothetical protein